MIRAENRRESSVQDQVDRNSQLGWRKRMNVHVEENNSFERTTIITAVDPVNVLS